MSAVAGERGGGGVGVEVQPATLRVSESPRLRVSASSVCSSTTLAPRADSADRWLRRSRDVVGHGMVDIWAQVIIRVIDISHGGHLRVSGRLVMLELEAGRRGQ